MVGKADRIYEGRFTIYEIKTRVEPEFLFHA